MVTNPDAVHARRVRIIILCLVVVPAWAGAIYFFVFYRGGTADVVEQYVASVRAGNAAPLATTDAEAEEALAAIRASTDFRTRNWTRSSNAACVWARFETAKGDVDIDFFLEDRVGPPKVTRLTTKGRCSCKGRGKPCRWEQ